MAASPIHWQVPGIGRVDACEIDRSCIGPLQANVDFNGIETVHAIHDDVRHLLLTSEGVYDVIDLDPYGTPAPYLDLAVSALADGGLLMVTATDMAVLCGNNMDTCYQKYHSSSLHKPYGHEQALRILLFAIDSVAAAQKKYIVPLLSMSIDFYVRVFLRVHSSAYEAKRSITKAALIW